MHWCFSVGTYIIQSWVTECWHHLVELHQKSTSKVVNCPHQIGSDPFPDCHFHHHVSKSSHFVNTYFSWITARMTMVKKGSMFKAKVRGKAKKQPNHKVIGPKNAGKKKTHPRQVNCCLKTLFRSICTNALRHVAASVSPLISFLSLIQPSSYLYLPLYFTRDDGIVKENIPACNQNVSHNTKDENTHFNFFARHCSDYCM
jgi:hypothetical protein